METNTRSIVHTKKEFEDSEDFTQVMQASWSDTQHCAPLPKKSYANRTMFSRVASITHQKGDAFGYILKQQGSDTQYSLLMCKYKVMGLDRPTIHTHKRVPVPVLEKLIADYEAGTPTKEMASKYGVSPSEVYYAIDKLKPGVPRRQLYVRLSNEVKTAIVSKYSTGGSINRISMETKRARSTIFRYLQTQRLLRAQKYTRRKSRMSSDEERAEILRLHQEGVRLADIALKFDRRVSTIRSIIVLMTGKNISDRRFVKITDDEKATMKAMYASGCLVSEIARATGHRKDSVKRIVGQLPLRKNDKITEEDQATIRECISKGMQLTATYRFMKKSKSGVRYWFDQIRKEMTSPPSLFSIRSHNGISDEEVQQVRDLHAHGVGYKKIGKLMNRHPKTIYSIVKNLNHKIPAFAMAVKV